MSQNSSSLPEVHAEKPSVLPSKKLWLRVLMVVSLPAWIFISFIAAQLITGLIIDILQYFNVSLAGLNENVFTTIAASFVYLLTIAIAMILPAIISKKKIDFREIGLNKIPSWLDIIMAPVGLVIYFIISVVLVTIATSLIPWFDLNQAQDTGFSELFSRYEYILAFITLVVIAPVAEEVLFRGYLFGKLKKYVPVWLAVIVTSLLFGAIHGAWNLAVDTFALSLVLCVLRQTTGSLWAPILLHMSKNSIAFYLLFINPLLFHTLGG